MDFFWTFIYPLFPAVTVIIYAEYHVWRDKSNKQAIIGRLDRMAKALEKDFD